MILKHKKKLLTANVFAKQNLILRVIFSLFVIA